MILAVTGHTDLGGDCLDEDGCPRRSREGQSMSIIRVPKHWIFFPTTGRIVLYFYNTFVANFFMLVSPLRFQFCVQWWFALFPIPLPVAQQ